MSLHQNEAGAQPAPRSRRPRRTVAPPLLVERVFEPDPARCIAAIVKLLAPRPSTLSTASTSSTPSSQVVAAEER